METISNFEFFCSKPRCWFKYQYLFIGRIFCLGEQCGPWASCFFYISHICNINDHSNVIGSHVSRWRQFFLALPPPVLHHQWRQSFTNPSSTCLAPLGGDNPFLAPLGGDNPFLTAYISAYRFLPSSSLLLYFWMAFWTSSLFR